MKNTNQSHDIQDEPVIRYDDDMQTRKHHTLLKVFLAFAVLAVIVILIIAWSRWLRDHQERASTIEDLESTSRPVETPIEARAQDLETLDIQSRDVTTTRDDRANELESLYNAQ